MSNEPLNIKSVKRFFLELKVLEAFSSGLGLNSFVVFLVPSETRKLIFSLHHWTVLLPICISCL